MRKNKLMWNIALFLIAIVSIPIAHAQIIGGQISYILINSLIVGVVLFILQSFLMTGKNDKEKTSVWVAIIAGSLLVGFLFGRSGFIWQGPLGKFFNIYILANTLIIGIAAYFIFGLIGIDKKLGSPEGKTGYGILIFIGSLVWAIGIANSYGNVFVWQAYKYFISFLIGPDGILNPYPPQYRLMVFAGSFVLLVFFFNNYLIPDNKNPYVNYGLALIIAMNMARSGANLQAVIRIGEVIFVLVLQKSLKASNAIGGTWGSWLVAIGLVGWASAAMTWDTPYEGLLAIPIGNILWFFGWITPGTTGRATGGLFGWVGMTGGVVFVVIGIIAIILWSIFRKEGMLREGRNRLWQEIKRLLRRNETIAGFMGETLASRNEIIPDELPFELKDMRLELYTLLNFMLRHEVWKIKTIGWSKKVDNELVQLEARLSDYEPTEEDIQRNLITHIEGAEVKEKEDGTEWELKGEGYAGWGRNYWFTFLLMEKFKEILLGDLTRTPAPTPQHELNQFLQSTGDALLGRHMGQIEGDRYLKYLTAVSRYKSVNVLRARRLYFYDMYNMYGQYVRGYHFAKILKDKQNNITYYAKPDIYSIEIESDNGVLRSINWKKIKRIAEKVDLGPQYEEGKPPDEEYLVELNLYGYSTADINAIQIDRRNPENQEKGTGRKIKGIRRYRKEDIQFLHIPPRTGARLSKMFSWTKYDWKYATEDMETGKFHPLSRKVPDYEAVIKKQYEVFSNAPFEHELSTEETAFDREALKNPGKFVYWGRKTYFTDDPVNPRKPPVNPYPTLTLKGLWEFIGTYAKRVAGDEEKTEKILQEYFKSDYEDVEKGPDKEKQQ